MPDRTSEEILKELQGVDLEILELTSDDAPWDQLGQTAEQAQAVEDYLDSVIEDIGSAKDDIEEKAEDFASAGEKFEEFLEIPEVKEGLEGVQGGLESSTNILEEVKGGVSDFKEFVETLQLGEGLTSDDAQEQLETAAEAFEVIVGKLEPFIDLIPGLGAFIQLWGLGIARAAEVAGVLIEKTDAWNDIYSTLEGNEGDYLYFTSDALASIKLRKLREKRADLYTDMIEAGAAEHAALDDINLPDHVSDRDIAVETAIRQSAGAQVPLMTPAYKEWADSTKALEESSAAQGRAQANFDAQSIVAEEAAAAAESDTLYSDDRLAIKAKSEADAKARAQTALDEANSNHDAVLDRHSDASAAHWAEVNGYRDTVKANIIKQIPKTNGGRGFSDADYSWLAYTYPQFKVTRQDVEAAAIIGAAAGATVGGAVPVTPSAAVGGAAGGAAAAGGMSSKTKRLVMIGGGGVLGMLMLGVVFILPGDSQTPGELKTAPIETESETVSEEPVETPVEEPVAEPAVIDVCDLHDLGCQDMGMLPSPQMVTVNWSDTGCDVTPQSTTAEMPFAASTGGPGASIPGDDVPGNRFHFGSGMVEGRGIGGGTVTSDGVTTGTRTFYEPGTVGTSGFSGSLFTEEGPANPETGELDRTQTHCTHGGAFDLQMDATVWQGLMDGPLLEETPFWVNNFACSTRWENGFPVIYWLLGVESPIPMPASPFTVEFFVRLGSWVNVDGVPVGTTMFQNTTMTPEQIWSMDPANAGTEPPDELVEAYEEGGTWGFLDFGTASEDAYEEGGQAAEDMQNALSNFNEGDFVDLSAKVSNGGLGAFAPSSIECPWQ